MTVNNWLSLYNEVVSWTIRGIKYSKEDKESFDDLITCLIKLNDFELDLFSHSTPEMTFDLTYDGWTKLCHTYINEYRDNYPVAEFFFQIFVNGQHYFDDFDLKLSEYKEYLKPATKKEIKQARKDFATVSEDWYDETRIHKHTFADDAEVLEYRGVRFIIDKEWGSAWYKTKDGKVHSFQLIWDWWYPLDRFISLEL